MPLIITATDFSDVAENAVYYACQLATQQHARLVVLHSFVLPVMFSDVPIPGSLVADARQDAEEQMHTLLNDLANRFPAIEISGKVIYGDTVDVLEEYKEGNIDPWLVIIGNSSLVQNNSWPDSILIDALKTLKYPVLAVPPGASFAPVKKLCFAMDNKEEGYEHFVQKLAGIVSQLNVELHVLNIQARGSEPVSINEHLKALLADLNPVYHLVTDAAFVDDAILEFAEKNEMDWLVMMPRKHPFFEALMHKSHTRALAHHSHLPVLAIHEQHA